MLNETLAALKERLEELNYPVFGPEIVMNPPGRNTPIELKISPNKLPCLVLSYTGRGKKEMAGGRMRDIGNGRKSPANYSYSFRGDILICSSSFKMARAVIDLFELTFGDSGVIEKLLEAPAPQVSEKYIYMDIGEAYSDNFYITNDETESFYLTEVIPCNINFKT